MLPPFEKRPVYIHPPKVNIPGPINRASILISLMSLTMNKSLSPGHDPLQPTDDIGQMLLPVKMNELDRFRVIRLLVYRQPIGSKLFSQRNPALLRDTGIPFLKSRRDYHINAIKLQQQQRYELLQRQCNKFLFFPGDILHSSLITSCL